MKKIYVTLTSIILMIFFSISIIVSKSILNEFNKRNENIDKLNYIRSLNNKIEIINNIYTTSNSINSISSDLDSLNSIILEKNNQIYNLRNKNNELKTIIDDFKK